MGLDTTHGAFHGAYSAFNRLRQAVCRAAGGSFPPHDLPDDFPPHRLECETTKRDWFYLPDEVTREAWPGLYAFLSHEDCDGVLTPLQCAQVAGDLEKLLPALEGFPPAGGHLSDGYAAVTRRFVEGCRLAASRGETLEFR
jgi:hypothetical protein